MRQERERRHQAAVVLQRSEQRVLVDLVARAVEAALVEAAAPTRAPAPRRPAIAVDGRCLHRELVAVEVETRGGYAASAPARSTVDVGGVGAKTRGVDFGDVGRVAVVVEGTRGNAAAGA